MGPSTAILETQHKQDQSKIVTLSTKRRQITAEHSGHHVQLDDWNSCRRLSAPSSAGAKNTGSRTYSDQVSVRTFLINLAESFSSARYARNSASDTNP
jgi:thiazole synthase ThiGH ThiG subunit